MTIDEPKQFCQPPLGQPLKAYARWRWLAVITVCLWAGSRTIACVTASDDAASSVDVTGHVVDEDKHTVSGTSVFACERVYGRDTLYDIRRTTTDRLGRFAFSQLTAGSSYMFLAKQEGFAVAVMRFISTEDQASNSIELTLKKPSQLTVQVTDPQGRPVPGASLQELVADFGNGTYSVHRQIAQQLGLGWSDSDRSGTLVVKHLPESAKISGILRHARFPVTQIPEVLLGESENRVSVSFSDGVQLTLHVVGRGVQVPDRRLQLDLVREEDTTTVHWNEPISLDQNDDYHVVVAPGKYSIRLRHPDLQAVPDFHSELRVSRGQPARFEIALTPRGTLTGRVIHDATGRPLANRPIQAFVFSPAHQMDVHGAGPGWSFSAKAMTDSQGEYKIRPGIGPVRLFLWYDHEYVGEDAFLSTIVKADQPTELPDLRVLDLPTLTGVVTDTMGNPIPNAVLQPVGEQRYRHVGVCDENGRFRFPVEEITRDKITDQTGSVELSVFHPYRPLEQRLKITLDPKQPPMELRIVLKPNPIASPPRPTVEKRLASNSPLGKKRAPEFVYQHVFNSDESSLRLADYRGKYVLLDFWATWCGGCLYAMPNSEAAEQIYRKHGLVVLGVHHNSVPYDTVSKFLDKNGPGFPVLLDSPKGTTCERYGIDFFPSYVLINPKGEIVLTSKDNSEAFRSELILTMRRFLFGDETTEPPSPDSTTRP